MDWDAILIGSISEFIFRILTKMIAYSTTQMLDVNMKLPKVSPFMVLSSIILNPGVTE